MDKEKKHLLVFGYGLGVILTFLGWRFWVKHDWILTASILFVIAAVSVVVTAINYELLKPVYKRWMKVAHCIGTVITTVILGIVYYGIFGVVGLVLRVIGKDLLDRRLQPEKESYWIKREDVPFDKKRYVQQF